jgi:hypothetical protein
MEISSHFLEITLNSSGRMYAPPAIFDENDTPREKARKNSLALLKEKNDTTGGNSVRGRF